MIEEVARADWEALVPDDAYLSREYAETALLLDPGELLLLHAEGTVFPCIVREWEGARDVTGLYGFGGPVGGSGFYDAYEDWCREREIVTTFTWFHPRFQNQRYSSFHVEPRGGTVAWRLEGDLFERLHRHHRRAVRKAREAGLETRVTVAPTNLGGFASLYERTMAEKGATGFYYFPDEYWQSLSGRDWLVLFEALEGDDLRAALLGLTGGGWLHYHLGASERTGGANNLLFLEAAEWAREHGFERFHLGGGVGGADDSLLQFKLRFDEGGLIGSAVGKAIHDEARYRNLGGDGFDGFFPAYRRATPSAGP